MKAALVSPVEGKVEAIDLSPDIGDWKVRIGADHIDHQTLMFQPDIIAIVDDDGLAKELPTFTIFAPALRSRITLAGKALIIASDDEQFVELTDAVLKRLDVIF